MKSKKFKKGDRVLIIAGSNKGITGNITSIADKRVIVDGVNLAKIHKKPTSSEQGKIVEVARPIHLSNISHVDSNGNAVRAGFGFENKPDVETPKKQKMRIFKVSNKKLV